MSSFCGSSFFNASLWDRESFPDVSSCFQQIIYYMVPSLLLILMSTCRIYHLYYSRKSGLQHHWLSSMQTVLCAALIVIPVSEMIRTITEISGGYTSHPVEYLTGLLRIAALVIAIVVVQMERRKGGRYFGGMFSFWIYLTLSGALILYSKIRQALLQGYIEDVFRLVTFAAHYTLVLAQLIVSFFPGPITPQQDKTNLSPEQRANYASRLTFWWFNDMVIKGYKNPIEDKDLYEVNEIDKAGILVPRFEKHWRNETNKLLRKSAAATKSVNVQADQEMTKMNGKEKDRKPRKLMVSTSENESLLGPASPDGGSGFTAKLPEGIHPSLIKCLAKVFLPSILMCAGLKLVHDSLLFVSPIVLRAVIRFVKDEDEPNWRGYFYAAVMFIFSLIRTAILHQYSVRALTIGMRLRSTICASIYNKAMKLTSGARRDSTTGEIVNLMSIDAQKFMELMLHVNLIWSAPFQIIISMAMLWNILGPSVLAGVAVTVILILLNIVIGNILKKLQRKQMKEKDKRTKLMSEILNGIKVLKLYAWEPSFANIINGTRKNELDLLKKSGYVAAINSFLWQICPFMIACCSFASYILSDDSNILDAEKAFVALSLFNIMRFPMATLPNLVNTLTQVAVAVNRISKFLSLEELNQKQIDRTPNKVNSVSMKDCTFTWNADSEAPPTLQDISVDVRHGELVAVVGVVGCGKSSLISVLLGDMIKVKGQVSVSGSVAYVSQQAWIQNTTLRNNVLFGEQYDKIWYDTVIEACALLPDLDMLPAGDLTEIGEKGINLSGGQKQRVSLARAIYSKASVYFLDDPLSAVDAHVGRHIFDKVISNKGLLRGQTRFLVTHGVNFLPHFDTILVLKEGKLSEQGSFKQLLNHKGAFSEFLQTHFLQENEDLTEQDIKDNSELIQQISEVIDDDFETLVRDRIASIHSIKCECSTADTPKRCLAPQCLETPVCEKSSESHLSIHDLHLSASIEAINATEMENSPSSDLPGQAAPGEKDKEINGAENKGDKLIKDETSKQGGVEFAVFRNYFSAMGWASAILVFAFFLMHQATMMGANFWLSKWSDDDSAFNDTQARRRYLGVYASFGLAQGILGFLAAGTLAIGAWMASKRLHGSLLDTILKCPMLFFDTTPTGRILNRFGKDIDTVDTLVPNNIKAFIWDLLTILSTLVVISVSTPWFLIVVVPLAIIYVIVQRFYVATSRQLKRLESVNLSPIYSHFGESLQGVATIRAFNKQQEFMSESLRKVDKHQQAKYPNIISNKWLAVRLEFMGAVIVLAAVLLAVISRNVGVESLTAGVAGLSITYALGVTNTLACLVRVASMMENNIVSVERIKEYVDLPTEAPWIVDINRPTKAWPSAGTVTFDRYSVRYREGLDLVLRNITCQIKGGEKIGICGRTGAGKSSLTLALFRILEGTEGAIYIDDVRTGAIGLHDLRNALTIIPQDPVVFSGTLRMNLDPFNCYTDDKLWEALEQTNLKTFVQSLDGGLEHICSEAGENLSVGQRQLICLARALLRRTKLLILDEATAAVDLDTDNFIQNTIRTAFADCTVLTIAHRLNTIIDYDRIMVLDAGEVKEFASPQELLANENSLFYSLAKEANINTTDKLTTGD